MTLLFLGLVVGTSGGALFGAYWQRSRGGMFKRHELAGFLGGSLVQFAPSMLTRVVYTTDKTIVFHHPRPKHAMHLMFVPRKDIKNVGELTPEDQAYVADLLLTVSAMVDRYQLSNYRLWTNGPGKQDVAYLHFHLGAD